MTDYGSQLTAEQRKAVAAMLTTHSVPKAAQAAGVPEADLRAWLEHSEVFRLAVYEAGVKLSEERPR